MSKILTVVHGNPVELAWLALSCEDEYDFHQDVRNHEAYLLEVALAFGDESGADAHVAAINNPAYVLALAMFYERQRQVFHDLLGPYLNRSPIREVSPIEECLCVSYRF